MSTRHDGRATNGGARPGAGKKTEWPDGDTPKKAPHRFKSVGNARVEHVEVLRGLARAMAHDAAFATEVADALVAWKKNKN